MAIADEGAAATDRQLMEALARGCEQSWREFYRRYQGPVFRFALQMTGSRALAEEAVQETFLALMRRAGSYDAGRGEAASYVFGIARNKVLGLRERERRHAGPAPDPEAAMSAALEDGMMRRQETELVRRAVLALPASYREVVVLCDLQQLDYEGAARAIGCAVGTVRSRLHRGRQLLAEKLAARLERRA
jgi:RNA polymerase sigma-70 factor (ECF subfamily)